MVTTDREIAMMEMYSSGKTLDAIGKMQNPQLSRERVRQLLKIHFNVTGVDGGAHISSLAKRKERQKNRDRRLAKIVEERLGCSFEFFRSVCPDYVWTPGSPSRFYLEQKRNARRLGIGWGITFQEWWELWSASGKWALRGKGQGYCMARKNNTGPFTKDNVKIVTVGQNFSERNRKLSVKG